MINWQVRTESGDIVLRGTRGLDWMTTARHVDEDRFPFLGSLLPYADTMFNSRQVERLLRELADPGVRDLLGPDTAAELGRLCREVADGTHLYLWFLGD